MFSWGLLIAWICLSIFLALWQSKSGEDWDSSNETNTILFDLFKAIVFGLVFILFLGLVAVYALIKLAG